MHSLCEQVKELTEQVAALATKNQVSLCYNCNQRGHLQRDCPYQHRSRGDCHRCYNNCDRMGHLDRECRQPPQENDKGGACDGQQVPQVLGLYDYIVMVASVREVTKRTINGVNMDIMLDSGSSVSLLHKDVASQMKEATSTSPSIRPQLVTASGDPLHIVDYIRGLMMFDKLKVVHNFIVVSELITQAILGVRLLMAA